MNSIITKFGQTDIIQWFKESYTKKNETLEI